MGRLAGRLVLAVLGALTTVLPSSEPGAAEAASGVEVRTPICEVIRFADWLPIDWQVFYLDPAAISEALA